MGRISDSVHCPLCGGTEHQVLFDLRAVSDVLSVPGLIANCCHCSMCFKILSEPDRLSQAYGEEYAAAEMTEQYMLSEPARAFFRKVLAGIEIMSGATKPRLLDVGTGLGALLEEAQKLGYEAEGVELCEVLVRKARARGLRVHWGPAEELDSPSTFDAVTMLDIIEHVTEPLKLLATARRLMKPGGRLVVYTPNHRGAIVVLARLLNKVGIGFAVEEIFGGNHVCFFDDRSLPVALQKQGFSLHSISLFPYDPSRPGQPISPVSLAAVTAVEWLGKPFNRMFRMVVHAGI
jgi:2-polyprenyl-3-methyl-5-hydroxy-6-metoxy-1,4-benzoquinol methylase